MQLIRALAIAGVLTLASIVPAVAQSLSPLHGRGPTPSLIKGFNLKVGNPYKTRMTFVIMAMNPGFTAAIPDAQVQPSLVTLAPGYSRPVLVTFKISPPNRERTIGVCIMPQKIPGTVLPRVCGTYTGVVIPGDGG